MTRYIYLFIILSAFSALSWAADGAAAVELQLQNTAMPRDLELKRTSYGTLAVKGSSSVETVRFKTPETLKAGLYRLSFIGSGRIYPYISDRSEELEPYRITTGAASGGAAIATAVFTFIDPNSREKLVDELPHPVFPDISSRIVTRISDRLLALKPGMEIGIEFRYGGIVFGGPVLLHPASPPIDMTISANNALHCFTDRSPPRFFIRVTNAGTPWNGSISLEWRDAVDGTSKRVTVPAALNAGDEFTSTAEFTARNGVYSLTATLGNKDGVITKVRRNFSYGPHIDAASLPDDWAFGIHCAPGDVALAPVGYKWVRVLLDWGRDIEAKGKGQFTWDSMDACVSQCRKGNKLLFVLAGTPRWASSKKGDDFSVYPPANWSDISDLLRVFWGRYAPGGRTDTVGAIEIWNEPNAADRSRFSVRDYAKLAEVVSTATRTYAPGVKVVGLAAGAGPNMDYVAGALASGAGKWLDVASLHLYEIDTPRGVSSIENRCKLFNEALFDRGLTRDVWDTETGAGMEIRTDGLITTQEELNGIAARHPRFDAEDPYRIGNAWRRPSERTGTAWMIRSMLQKLALGVDMIFSYCWADDPHAWVHDVREGGNVMPKLMIPAQAYLSSLWKRYGGRYAGAPEVISVTSGYDVHAFRFFGGDGSFIAIFAHPSLVTAGTTEHAVKRAGTDAENVRAERCDLNPWLRMKPQPRIPVTVYTTAAEVRVTDMLGREEMTMQAPERCVTIDISDEPVYIIE
ncbi:MAG: hypothetical protein AABZ39_17110 [Spirochaetota bacterium]